MNPRLPEYFESQNSNLHIPLLDNYAGLVPEASAEFGLLLKDIRKLRWFVMDHLSTLQLRPTELANIYQVITKVIIISSLKLMGVNIPQPGVAELLEFLEKTYQIDFQSQSLYGFDSDSLLGVIENATGKIEDNFADRLNFYTQEENAVLAKIQSGGAFHLGFLSKGIIYAYVWLNKRLVHLVQQGKLDRQAAEDYLNNNLTFAAIKRISDTDVNLVDAPGTKYEVGMSAEVETEIANAIAQNRTTEVIWGYDEAISSGKSFLAFMKHLVAKHGEQVVHLVKFYTPDFYLEYVEPSDRWDFSSGKNPDGTELNSSMAIPTDETKWKYVWRMMSPAMGRYQSIGFNDDEV